MAKMNGITVLDHVPEGWRVLRNANTAPRGFRWISNRKSRWSGEYQHALVPEGAVRNREAKNDPAIYEND